MKLLRKSKKRKPPTEVRQRLDGQSYTIKWESDYVDNPEPSSRLRTWLLVSLALLAIAGLVFLRLGPPPNIGTINPDTVASGDRQRVENDNYHLNVNSTARVTKFCFISKIVSTAKLPFTIGYNWIEGTSWNATGDSNGCTQWNGVAGVSYIVSVTVLWPPLNKTLKIGAAVTAGSARTVDLDEVVG